MPVPLIGAGSFVEGLREDERMSGLAPATSPDDRELGAVAQCELRFSLSGEALRAVGEEQPVLVWVSQVVDLLTDADAAARWLMTKTRRFEDFEGQEVDGFLYRNVHVDITLTGLGEEAVLAVAHTETPAGTPTVDTYINFRTGRLFGGVAASTYKELEVRPQLVELAHAFLSRMETILTGNEGPPGNPMVSEAKVRPGGGARSSSVDRIVEAVAVLAVVIGWPSAVILAIAHSWGPVFSSDVTLDVARTIMLGFAGFVVLPFAVMGLGPVGCRADRAPQLRTPQCSDVLASACRHIGADHRSGPHLLRACLGRPQVARSGPTE
jgi:hypothetical protein